MSGKDSLRVIKVWDPLIRVFHWSLALFFTVAYLSEGDFETLHFYMGYGISVLIAFRLLWGIIGPEYARFTNFVTGKNKVVQYLKSLLAGKAEHHVGHNPAGGIMVIALLIGLALTCFFGMALIAIDDVGPLAGSFVASFNEHLVKELHEICANVTLALVFIHLAGVVVSSLLHRENLIRAMFTGVKVIGSRKSNTEKVEGEAHV